MNKAIDKVQAAKNSVSTTAREIGHWDKTRPDFPGEHLLVAAAGVALLLAAGRSRSPLKSMLFTAAGTAVLGRAASGRGGVARVASWLVRK